MSQTGSKWSPETPQNSKPFSPGEDPALEPLWRQDVRRQARQGEVCPACLGLGWVRNDHPFGHPQFGTVDRCPACQRGEVSEYLSKASGLVGWQAAATFADFYELEGREEQLTHARGIVEQGWGWLTLWGGFGTGKTYLLAAVVNECLKQKRPAVYISAARLLDVLREAYSPEGPGFAAAFSQWLNCQVLAIDEVDVFHETSWSLDKYRQLLEHRYNMAVAGDGITVFASNARPGSDDWPGRLGWLASRMMHFDVVEATGGDVRPILRDEPVRVKDESTVDPEYWQDKWD